MEAQLVSSEKPTFVLEKVAHSSPSGQNKLRHVLDNLGFILRGQGSEPFCQTLVCRQPKPNILTDDANLPLCPVWTTESNSCKILSKVHAERASPKGRLLDRHDNAFTSPGI